MERDKRKILLEKLNQAINFSEQSRWQRFLKKPFFTLSRSLMFHLFDLLGGKNAIPVKGVTFWNETVNLSIPDGDTIFQWSFFNLDTEVKLTKFLIKTLNKNSVFFDVGAYFGFYSLLAANFIDSNGSIHAFEPTPRTFSFLKKNCEKHKNIFPNQIALWDSVHEIEFHDLGPLFSVCNTYLNHTEDENLNRESASTKRLIKVKTTILDSYLKEKNISRIDFIKIDVERAEPFVLRGAKDTIVKFHPTISIEVLGEHWGKSDDESIAILKSCGYNLFLLDEEANLISFDEKSVKNFVHENLIAVYEKS
jgi:FkbM family methyltransferase